MMVCQQSDSDSSFTFRGADVVEVLERVSREVGLAATIRVDQGTEFVTRDLDLWAYQRGVTLDFSRPGKPTDNSFIEAFNGRFRAECLNAHWFLSLADARKSWRIGVSTTMKNALIGLSAEDAEYADVSRWRRQPAIVREPEKSTLRRSKVRSQCT
jgi:transposase InsO family protein